MRVLLYVFCIAFLTGCDTSKWERIKGVGIDDEPKSIDPIYFQNPDNGVVGGYILVKGNAHRGYDGMESIPLLYVTKNGGHNWEKVSLQSNLRGRITYVYLNSDTLICVMEDSTIVLSVDRGKTNDYIKSDHEYQFFKQRYFAFNRYQISNPIIELYNVQYSIKEIYENEFSTVVVCRGPETLVDYYFVSFDNRKSWKYLQKDYGNVRKKFLYKDMYLFSYDYPFGLSRLKLK
ncbi:MAG: hypothetical protein J7604_09570 [Sporocytophaga sp.]|uniref:hypothetical protein n=1 Tax=Sporocytophaga sp. TaxID=2231183 RepID=UPI001B0026E8|nr:hypothetical protein [Sporocytophaga sp.]MBO9700444.1 hypothetical protein [Sporocytophaga sp.]